MHFDPQKHNKENSDRPVWLGAKQQLHLVARSEMLIPMFCSIRHPVYCPFKPFLVKSEPFFVKSDLTSSVSLESQLQWFFCRLWYKLRDNSVELKRIFPLHHSQRSPPEKWDNFLMFWPKKSSKGEEKPFIRIIIILHYIWLQNEIICHFEGTYL